MESQSSIYAFGDKYDHTYFGFSGDSIYYKNKCKSKKHVLYLGIGTGRIFSKIYFENKAIIGLDNSREMISRLIKNYSQINKENIILSDIRKYDFPKNYYDIIIAPYAFFNFFSFDENKVLFKKIYQSLKKGGEFTADFLSPFLNPQFNKSKEIILNKKFKTIIEYDFINQEFVETNYYKNENLKTKLHNFYFYPTEITNMLKESGFDKVKIFGNYKHKKLNTKSEFVLAECKKL